MMDAVKKFGFLVILILLAFFVFTGCPEETEHLTIGNEPDKQDTAVAAEKPSYYLATFTASDEKIGDAEVRLKKGFDYVKTDSSQYNTDLELIAVTLSSQIYTNANGTHADDILYGLGYDYVIMPQGRVAAYERPVSCFAYKRLNDGSNVFAVVVRGTDSAEGMEDILTDVGDGAFTMFEDSAEAVRDELEQFMLTVTQKTSDELKREKNYFFFTGHSLGGAVANCLSVDNVIKEYAAYEQGQIYTYTFESPHTCVNLWWTDPESESNALNFKVNGDAVTNLPPYIGSTTYGKDEWIQVSELDDSIFNRLFRNAQFSKIDGNVGYHDTCLGLIYIIGNTTYFSDDVAASSDTVEFPRTTESSLPEYEMYKIMSAYGVIGAWHYDDYDQNGTNEAFAVTIRDPENERLIEAVYFIDHEGKVTLMASGGFPSLYNDETDCYYTCQGKGFFFGNYGAFGSGYSTFLFSVKAGKPYELDISRKLQGFFYSQDDGCFYTTENDFSKGYHTYPEYVLEYDPVEQQFRKGRLLSEGAIP